VFAARPMTTWLTLEPVPVYATLVADISEVKAIST
jgi:hypothetical protein